MFMLYSKVQDLDFAVVIMKLNLVINVNSKKCNVSFC